MPITSKAPAASQIPFATKQQYQRCVCPSGYRYGSGGYHCQLRSCAVQNSSDDEDDGDMLGENKGAMVPEMVIGNA